MPTKYLSYFVRGFGVVTNRMAGEYNPCYLIDCNKWKVTQTIRINRVQNNHLKYGYLKVIVRQREIEILSPLQGF